MRRDAGTTDSVWEPIHELHTDGVLERDARADVCVVGAGMVGLCTAYEMMRQGLRVIVLDDGPVGGGESARLVGDVRSVPRHLGDLVRAHGRDDAELAIRSHVDAMDWLEDLIDREGIRCGWKRVPGHLVSEESLDEEHRLARQVGLHPEPTKPGFAGQALRFEDQAILDPTAFLAGLAKALRASGVRIHTSTHAARAEDEGVVTSMGRWVRCKHIVEATNAPVFGEVDLPQQAYRTYNIAAQAPGEEGLFWSDEHLIRRSNGEIIVSGAPHPTGAVPDPSTTFGALEAWARDRLQTGRTSHRWSAQVWHPQDGLGFIGRAQRTLVATGNAGNPCARAAVAARLLGDIVARRDTPWNHLYDPQRTKLPEVRPWRKEKRHLSAARRRVLMMSEVRDPSAIGRGQGAIMRRGIRLFAFSRDEDGILHERLAVCPHDGFIVAWNAAEKTWDCPWDGSRYDRYGTVINAPANVDLGSYSSQPTDGVCPVPPLERTQTTVASNK